MKAGMSRGVDVCRESAEYGKSHRGVDIFPGTLEEARFADGTFGAVHFSHLIEHVPDPRGFLGEVKRILAPGGYALITTPNIDGFQARLFGKAWRSAIADQRFFSAGRRFRHLSARLDST